MFQLYLFLYEHTLLKKINQAKVNHNFGEILKLSNQEHDNFMFQLYLFLYEHTLLKKINQAKVNHNFGEILAK